MENLKVYLPLVDGSLLPLDYKTGKELIKGMVSDDIGPPPRSLVFEATNDDGRVVKISIPFKESGRVHVSISGDGKE